MGSGFVFAAVFFAPPGVVPTPPMAFCAPPTLLFAPDVICFPPGYLFAPSGVLLVGFRTGALVDAGLECDRLIAGFFATVGAGAPPEILLP